MDKPALWFDGPYVTADQAQALAAEAAARQESRTVADLIRSIHMALKWAGKKNPNKALLVECAYALDQLARELGEARAQLGTRAIDAGEPYTLASSAARALQNIEQ
jgi:hypothetical protein